MLNSAATGEPDTLTETQMTNFRQGLLSHLGQQGFDEFFDELYRRELAANGDESPPQPALEPPFMEMMRLHRNGHPSSCSCWKGPWGFIVYKSRDIDVASERWLACKERFCELVTQSVEAPYRGYPGVDECMGRLSFTWIEEDSMGGIESAISAYDALDPHPMGSDHGICLFITPASLDSILDVPVPLAMDGKLLKRRYRKEIPHVVALSGKGFGEEEDWRGYFNVAVESLIMNLFPAIAGETLTPWELGGHITGEDIWCEMGRYGIHKAGVGYWDKRTQRQPE